MTDTNPAEARVMRAIIDRFHRQALAERRAARAAAEPAPSPASSVGWSTKAPPARKPSPIEIELARTARANHDAWAQRHPGRARAERQLRKGRIERDKAFDHKREGTAATHAAAATPRLGALARLYAQGSIDAEQLAWAHEIALVAERIGADVTVKTSSVETRIDAPRYGDGGFHERLGQVRREVAYGAWRRSLGSNAAPVLEMIVGDAFGYSVIAKRYHMHNRRAKALLIDAIDRWPVHYLDACRAIDEAALDRAHARLA
ncbi:MULTISPECIES: hypothetical protein [Sphingomonas]|uniref:hypothetical protein n=1 Tax=Sphingomonas TaxID=13687 RepID=UPI00082A17A1|nr:hypothetical protein [Sphingomonas sp. CCH10-B3]